MRQLRISVMTILVLGLLAGSTMAAAAQSAGAAADPMVPVPFTARLEQDPPVEAETFVLLDGRRERRVGFAFEVVDATDPRVEGRMIRFNDSDTYAGPSGPSSFALDTQTIWIENDEGAWRGSRNLLTTDDYSSLDGVVILAGEGTYAGLVMALEDSDDFGLPRGVIFPSGPPPERTAP